jgi:hypothetical protein
VRYSLFAYNQQTGAEGESADFDSVVVTEEAPRRIPYGKQIELVTHHDVVKLQFGKAHTFTAINIDVYLRKNFKKD